jgi:hypothetical protein
MKVLSRRYRSSRISGLEHTTPCDRPRWLDEPERGRRLLTPAGLFLPTAYLTLRERDLTAARRATKALAVPR